MVNRVRPLGFISARRLAWLGLLLALGVRPVAARLDRPINAPVAPFRITEQGGEIGTEFHYLGETDKSDGDSVSFSNRSFEEYILYRMRGYVYHPRLLDIDSQIKLGLLQQVVRNSGLASEQDFSSGDSNTFIHAYNFYLSFLKEHPLSFSVHASRDHDAVMELFTNRLLVETQDLGATVNWKKGPFPMSLSASEARFKEWGFDSRSESRMKTLDYVVRNAVGNWMNTELRYHFQDFKQSYETDSDLFDIRRRTHLKSNDLNFTNNIYLDNSRRSYLNSNLRWYDQRGTDSFQTLTWQERLVLQHTPNFRTYYLFNYLQSKLREDTLDSYRGEIGLEHKLFESLEEHLDLHWRQSDFAGTSERQVGPTGRLGYLKRTPWGMLSMGYGRTIEQVERTGASGVRPIHREEVTMRDGVDNFLSQPNVIISSIVVTDSRGQVTYDEGFDYEIVRQGNRVALRPITGRGIRDGATVLVDYDVEFTNNISFISDDQNFHINHDFQKYLTGLSLYYRWHNLAARDAPEDDLSILEFNDNLVGLTYRWRWLTWREEYDVYRSTFSDYNQLLSQLEGLHQIGARVRLGWRVGAVLTQYTQEDLPHGQDRRDAVFAGASLRGPIRTRGYWETEVEARKETGQLDETLLGFLGKLGWRWRRVKVEAGARAEGRKRFDTERDRYSVFFQFAREF